MTNFEKIELQKIADDFIRQVQYAIKNKPIDRYSKRLGNFSSSVNASGELHDSLEKELTPDGIKVTCLAYIDYLIYGRPPGGIPPTDKIQSWLDAKGFDYNVYAVSSNIGQFGSTIWQRHKGADSGLLADIDISDAFDELENKLSGLISLDLFSEVA